MSSHNHPPSVPSVEYIDEERELLDIDKVKQWREIQFAVLSTLRDGAVPGDTDYLNVFNNGIDGSLKAHLDRLGVPETSGHFSEVFDLFRAASIDKIDDEMWRLPPSSRPDHLASGEDVNDDTNTGFKRVGTMVDDLKAIAAPTTPSPAPVPAPVPTPAPTAPIAGAAAPTPDEIKHSREELAEITAKRQLGLGIDEWGLGERRARFDDLRSKYETTMRDHVRQAVETMPDGTDDEKTEKRMRVAELLLGNFRDLQLATNESMGSAKRMKFIRFMTEGGIAKRIAKGVVFGLAVGTVGSLLTAATGGAAAGVAAGLVMTGRFARGYAVADANKNPDAGVITVDDDKKREMLTGAGVETDDGADAVIDKLNAYLGEQMDDNIADNVKKRRRSAGIAALSMMPGVFLGGTIAHVAHEATSHISHAWHGLFGNSSHHGTSGGSSGSQSGNSGGSGSHGGSGGDHNGSSGGPGDNHGNHQPLPTPDKYSLAAETIKPGEGFYQTFHEMGIPQDSWDQVLHDAGPQLHEMHLAYRMPSGQWGINMTPDGKMPVSALDVISKTYNSLHK
jgi:uncharacterized membrane protein YgcG